MAKKERKAKNAPSLESFQNEIRQRAEELFRARTANNFYGSELTDWLAAEKEIKTKHGIK